MKALLIFKKAGKFRIGRIAVVSLLIFSFLAVFPFKTALAIPVEITASVPQTVATVKQTFWQRLTKLTQKAGSLAFQRVLSSALNKIAYDAADYIGSGGQGQKPLFITKGLGAYLEQIGDEAAGQFIESFVNNLNTPVDQTCAEQLKKCKEECVRVIGSGPSSGGIGGDATPLTECYTLCDKQAPKCAVQNPTTADEVTPSFNVCSPSSLEAKVKIGLGLVNQTRPSAPNCTASQIIASWGDDINKKIDSLKDGNYLNEFVNLFDPRSNDVGIFVTAQTDLSDKVYKKNLAAKDTFITNKGYLDVRNIAGTMQGVPQSAQNAADDARAARQQALGKTTGDILVDAANVFLNQLYISAFDNLLRSLGKTTESTNTASVSNSQSDPGANVGLTALNEVTNVLLQAKFETRADYDILSELSICLDPQNPGPTNCVIDSLFLQAITEKKTVAEAINEGYLHGDWQLTKDNLSDAYNLRNISILRNYRILPVGWEEAVNKALSDPANPKKLTLLDYLSCFNPNDQYNTFSAGFNTSDQGWCQGLIDPNWVLKAPLNYCQKEGIGAQILSRLVTPGIGAAGGVAAVPSELSVSRADEYCADNQTCIKEKSDGSCEAYGYCNEERRTWNFGSDSCNPINNTCQSFSNTDSGSSAAYLKNTLDYDSCTSENSGCRQYALSGTYATSTNTVEWNGGQSVYLNKNASVCDSSDNGCSELMRLRPTWGSNLIMNSDFTNDEVGATAAAPYLNNWPLSSASASIVNSSLEPGGSSGKALRVNASANGGGVYSNRSASLLPANFQTISGQAYTLSADIYLSSGNNVSLSLGAAGEGYVSSVIATNVWQHVSVSRVADSAYNDPDFFISGYSSNGQSVFYIKNLKFEISSWDTGYASYGRFKVYEKLLPNYLEKTCYVDAVSATKNYSLKSDAPAVCGTFARQCNKEEAGCEAYSSVFDNFTVPAKVVSGDYCSSQCVGYDIYVAKASHFNPAVSENLIPSTATVCSAAAAGCNEFTNLDELAAGGEQKEYYTSLKQCVKPSAATCATFYSWEGVEGGYQLQSYSLKSLNNAPEVTEDDSALCNADVYNLPLTDPDYNPDCREFYNTAGTPFYHLTANTITCSENCHAYRLSEQNIVKNLSAAQCTGADKHWNPGDSTCNVCMNGGVWDINNGACIYQAIPGEGQTCTASENGCREYNGNRGNNVRLITSYDFESGVPAYWTSNCVGGLSLSTISNSNNGHSLQYTDSAGSCQPVGTDVGAPVAKRPLIEKLLANPNVAAQLAVGNSVTRDNAYTIKFLARTAVDTDLQIYFLNRETGERAYFNNSKDLRIQGGNEWKLYQVSLDNLNHVVSPNERLIISSASGNFLFDNFTLSEITDRYYLVKNSSQIPNVCYYDIFDQYQGADYNLGCSQYTDRGSLVHNLRQFSQLCSNSAVGCEQVIDTHNYSLSGPGIWNDANNNGVCDPTEKDCTAVAGDTTIYAVYDTSKLCSSSAKGCSRLGQGQGGVIITSWVDNYRSNNPDTYGQSLCQQENVGCEEWRSSDDGSVSYFKNPGSNTCVYRLSNDPTISGKNWYKVPAKRCDVSDDGSIAGSEIGAAICTGDTDCGGHKCIIDNNDYPCSVSSDKTIGYGGSGNQVWMPDTAAGLCEATQSGCTEYIDPVSQFAPNLVYNSSYQSINGSIEGWGVADPDFSWTPSATQQVIRLDRNKLYSLTIKEDNGGGNVSLQFLTGVRALQADNSFGSPTNTLSINNVANKPEAIVFNSLNNVSALLSGGTNLKTIEIKELVIDYQLESQVDKTSCNGLSKFDNGCILFNERSIAGASGLTSLQTAWDAYKTLDGATPAACNPNIFGSCSANKLVKVRPNRVCSQWLDCVTYVEDPVTKQQTCYAVGECDRLNDKNECANFISENAGTRTFDAKYDKNATGYSLLNKYYFAGIKEVGLNTTAHYDFEDSIPPLTCRRDVGDTATSSSPCIFDKNIYQDYLVREPENAPTDYPAHGRTYLKVPVTSQISPLSGKSYVALQAPGVGLSTAYYLSYMVNTRNSGFNAKVIITDEENRTMNDVRSGRPLIATSTANTGWETRVFKFNIGQGDDKIKIYLTSDASDIKASGYVYFDNLNIEPVLEVGENQYAVRECRLYPTDDSLTCVNKDKNVISDGLEGYCLEHDAFNPGVCLTWYPVDKISSAQAAQSALGYQGTYPLNYCTEVDANFSFVEKRTGARSLDSNAGGSFANCQAYQSGEYCSECPGGTCEDYFFLADNGGDGTSRHGGCFPKLGRLIPSFPIVTRTYQEIGINCNGSFAEGWGIANGNDTKNCRANAGGSCIVYHDGVKIEGIPNGAVVQDEYLNASPPLRIYDYNSPATQESELKYYSSSDTDEQFRLTCSEFVEVVDGSGDNKAWMDRISKNSIYATSTPRFFVTSSGAYYGDYGAGSWDIDRYGRNVESVPFGAAAWPDDFSLLNYDGKVPLRNQYSTKNGEDVFAGRPYGCQNDLLTPADNGCQHIGSCSLDPSVYCLTFTGLADDVVGKQSCAGLGWCKPLWETVLSGGSYSKTYSDMLKTLFLKPFNSYSFVDGAYISSDRQYDDASIGITSCGASRIGEGVSSFCSVFPTLSNIKLYAGNSKTGIIALSGSRYNIPGKGIYRLEFNSKVDAEQQPLRKIVIDWGDGNQQVVSGEDHHPTNPHSFYHYYSTSGTNTIKITIYDNWDSYRTNLP